MTTPSIGASSSSISPYLQGSSASLSAMRFFEESYIFSESCSFLYMFFISLMRPLRDQSLEDFQSATPDDLADPAQLYDRLWGEPLLSLLDFADLIQKETSPLKDLDACVRYLNTNSFLFGAGQAFTLKYGQEFSAFCFLFLQKTEAIKIFFDARTTPPHETLESNLSHALMFYAGIVDAMTARARTRQLLSLSPFSDVDRLLLQHCEKTVQEGEVIDDHLNERLGTIVSFFKERLENFHNQITLLCEQLNQVLRDPSREKAPSLDSDYPKGPSLPLSEHVEAIINTHKTLMNSLDFFNTDVAAWNRFMLLCISTPYQNVTSQLNGIALNQDITAQILEKIAPESVDLSAPFPEEFHFHHTLMQNFVALKEHYKTYFLRAEFIFDTVRHLAERAYNLSS